MTATSDSTPAQTRVVELRIHGVGGSPGPSILGLESAEDAVVVAGGPGTVFLGRRAEQQADHRRPVEGYDWGVLTSASPLQPLWVLLLPFTLANVAGWAHPDLAPRRLRFVRGASHLSSGLLTAMWTVWVSLIFVDLLGSQWAGRLLQGSRPNLFGIAFPPPDQLAAAAGLLLALGLMWGLAGLSRRSQVSAEKTASRVAAAPSSRWATAETLSSRTFFAHSVGAARLVDIHKLIVLVVLFAVGFEMFQAFDAAAVVDLGDLHRTVMTMVFFGLFLLFACGDFFRGGWAGFHPFAASMLAVSITTAVFTGLDLLLVKRLNDWPRRRLGVSVGQEVALVDVSLWILILWVAMIVAWVLWHRRRGTAEDVGRDELTSDGQERLGCPRNGAVPALVAQTARARGAAAAANGGARLIVAMAVAGFFTSAVFAFLRFDWGASLGAERWQVLGRNSIVSQLAAYLFPAMVLAAMGLVRASATNDHLRRGIGILWDVLTFWPRRYHPFAVKPYSERAVPEFQARILKHALDDDGKVLVSAHSQGSALAMAALAPLESEIEGKVSLLTYGSPIRTLFGLAFPAYFGPAQVRSLRAKLVRWTNLYRRTDFIGGPIFVGEPEGIGADIHVPDPAEIALPGVPSSAIGDPEPQRDPWVSLAGHSHYHRERQFKSVVAEMTAELAGLPSLPSDSVSGESFPRASQESEG